MSKIEDLNIKSIKEMDELKIPDDILTQAKIEICSCGNIKNYKNKKKEGIYND